MKSDFVHTSHKWMKLGDHEVALYNSHDVVHTAQLIPILTDLLAKNKQLAFYQQWFSTMAPVVERMQARGVGELDETAQKIYTAKLQDELGTIEGPILNAAPWLSSLESEAHQWHEATLQAHPTWEKKAAIGLRSRLKKIHKRREGFFNRAGEDGSPDLARLLWDHLGLKPAPKTQTRAARSTSTEALFYVIQHIRKMDEPHRWVLEDLFHRSRLHTILTRYMSVEADTDGRVRPLVKLGGTETLRLAYAGDEGEAIQQWPSECRHVIRPQAGHLFVARDFSAIEARLMAILAQDTQMLEVFAAGGDVHKQNAVDLGLASASNWDSMDPTVRVATRNWAKTFLYGLGYGGSPETMKTKAFCPCHRCVKSVPPTLTLSRDDIKRASDRWARKHEPILRWRRDLVESIKGPEGDHSWTSPFGYRRYFLEPRAKAERSIYNFPMQHCASQIVNKAMIGLDAVDAPLVLQMHDELMLEVEASKANHWLGVMKEVMEAPVKELGGWKFPTEGAVGEHWGALK